MLNKELTINKMWLFLSFVDRTSEQEKQQKKQVVSQVKERKSASKNACKVTTLPQQKIIVEERRR